MRNDMAKVVTERPRRGHGNPSKKWGRRLRRDEYDADDHGPARARIARGHQYSWQAKEFSDLLGPLRRYLRKQVGRPWDKVWSEITRNLDSRSLTGQHIFNHIRWDVEQHAWTGPDGRLYHSRRSSPAPIGGLYVDPTTRLLRYARESWRGHRGGPFVQARAALRTFGIDASTAGDIRRYRVDDARVWEHRECGWFIHTYRFVPEQLLRVVTRGDGREVRIHSLPRYERAATKQASKKEIREAREMLERDPLSGAEEKR